MAGPAAPTPVPDRGDLIWLDFDPQAGHEQKGRRPALVLSPASYNGRAGLIVCCPITNQVKGYPFEVVLPAGLPITGAVLSDQVRSLDWRARSAQVVGQVPTKVYTNVRNRIALLI